MYVYLKLLATLCRTSYVQSIAYNCQRSARPAHSSGCLLSCAFKFHNPSRFSLMASIKFSGHNSRPQRCLTFENVHKAKQFTEARQGTVLLTVTAIIVGCLCFLMTCLELTMFPSFTSTATAFLTTPRLSQSCQNSLTIS